MLNTLQFPKNSRRQLVFLSFVSSFALVSTARAHSSCAPLRPHTGKGVSEKSSDGERRRNANRGLASSCVAARRGRARRRQKKKNLNKIKMAPLKPVPESGPLVEKRSLDGAVSVTRVTKSEEAVFNLKPGKDAIVRLAAALQPFAPVFDFVSEGLQVRRGRGRGPRASNTHNAEKRHRRRRGGKKPEQPR